MDALELVKKDHQAVKDLFKRAETNKDEKQQKQLFEQIKTELETHTRDRGKCLLSRYGGTR